MIGRAGRLQQCGKHARTSLVVHNSREVEVERTPRPCPPGIDHAQGASGEDDRPRGVCHAAGANQIAPRRVEPIVGADAQHNRGSFTGQRANEVGAMWLESCHLVSEGGEERHRRDIGNQAHARGRPDRARCTRPDHRCNARTTAPSPGTAASSGASVFSRKAPAMSDPLMPESMAAQSAGQAATRSKPATVKALRAATVCRVRSSRSRMRPITRSCARACSSAR